MALQDPNVGPASVRVLSALRGSPESSCPPELLLRYEITFDRQFFRAHATKQPQQPYHLESPAGQTWKDENVSIATRTPEVVENTQGGCLVPAPFHPPVCSFVPLAPHREGPGTGP